MSICPECGCERPQVINRGPLRVEVEPPRAYWRGIRLYGITPVGTRMLGVLAARGRAAHFALQLCCPSDTADQKTVDQHLFKLRRKLPAGLRINNIYGWSYELEVEEDVTHSNDPALRTIKAKLAAAVEALPDDVRGGLLIFPNQTGRITVAPVNLTLPGTISMLGLATVAAAQAVVAQAPS